MHLVASVKSEDPADPESSSEKVHQPADPTSRTLTYDIPSVVNCHFTSLLARLRLGSSSTRLALHCLKHLSQDARAIEYRSLIKMAQPKKQVRKSAYLTRHSLRPQLSTRSASTPLRN